MGDNFGPVTQAPSVPPSQSDLLANKAAVLAEVTDGSMCLICSCFVVVSDVMMQCTTVPGVGANFTWNVRVGGQYSNLAPNMTSYHPPTFSGVSGNGAFGSPTEGGPVVRRLLPQCGSTCYH